MRYPGPLCERMQAVAAVEGYHYGKLEREELPVGYCPPSEYRQSLPCDWGRQSYPNPVFCLAGFEAGPSCFQAILQRLLEAAERTQESVHCLSVYAGVLTRWMRQRMSLALSRPKTASQTHAYQLPKYVLAPR